VGPSMLSLDGAEHKRHRDPFAEAFRSADSAARLEEVAEAEASRLVAGLAAAGEAELRRSVAGPLAVAVVADVLGLGQTDPKVILAWYDEIVGAVSGLAGQSGHGPDPDSATAGSAAFAELSAHVRAAIGRAHGDSLLSAAAGAGGLRDSEVVSNAAVLMFGGIETTEGMICNAILHLLDHPAQLAEVIGDPGLAANAIDESLRLEPAAAVVDRYATADVTLAGAAIPRGDLVTVSLAGAGRDPAFFPDPDRFDLHRANARQNLAFAHGPHFCLGANLARLETRAAMAALLRLPGLRLDPARRLAPRGVVFRKPPALHVQWDVPALRG
jgi:cytochrome P450